jgi:spermidine synthase
MAKIEILGFEETPLGSLCLRRRGMLARPGTVVTEITLGHELLMSSYHTESERALAEGALAFHAERASRRGPGTGTHPDPAGDALPRNLRVLIGGLGLGYTAEAVLACDRVAEVDVVELLAPVIDWMGSGLVPLSSTLTGDPRYRAIHADVFAALAAGPDLDPSAGDRAGPPTAAQRSPPPGVPDQASSSGPVRGRYDLILIDVDHSPDEPLGEESQGFYSAEGLDRARAHLAEGGVLGVWSYAEDSAFARAQREVFDEVRVVPVRYLNEMVNEEQEDWLVLCG